MLDNGRYASESAAHVELLAELFPAPRQLGRCETLNHMVATSFMSYVSYGVRLLTICSSKMSVGNVRLFKYMQIGICPPASQETTGLDSYVLVVPRKSLINWPLPSLGKRADGSGQKSLRIFRWRKGLQQALTVGYGESAFVLRVTSPCGT